MSNRRLREKADKLKIQQENPSLWTGLRKPGQPSKIFNRAEAEAEYQSNIEAARILAQKKAAELEGGAPATTGQAEPTGQPASRLDASPTPRLDAQNQSPTGAPPRRETFAEADARTRREAELAGKFGEKVQKRAENLEGREGLFAEMKTAAQKAGGDIPMDDMTRFGEQAKKLGIADENFERTAFRVEGGKFAAPTAPAPSTPLTGGALARSNIAKMGQAGAVADYFKRAEAEKAAAQQKRNSAFADQSLAAANKMAPEAPMSFASTFGSEIDRNEPSPAATTNAKPTVPTLTPPVSVKPTVSTSTPVVSVKPTTPTKPVAGSVYSSGTTMDTQQNRVRLASEAADKRMKEGDTLIKRRRDAQSSGIFPRDSVLGGITRWLQNDNFSTR